MNFYVYLICSKNNDNRLISYVGYTNNLKNRIEKHNLSKGAKFTRGKKWKLLYKKNVFLIYKEKVFLIYKKGIPNIYREGIDYKLKKKSFHIYW